MYNFLDKLFGIRDKQDYCEWKIDWAKNACSWGQHFVGIRPGVCEICGERATIIYDDKGNIVSWKWAQQNQPKGNKLTNK